MDWIEGNTRFSAQGSGLLFGQQTRIQFGAYKKQKGSPEEIGWKVYAIVSLPEGLKISTLPGMETVPGVTEAPVMDKGALIGFSNFEGTAGSLNSAFVSRDLCAQIELSQQNYGMKVVAEVEAEEMDHLTKMTDAALVLAHAVGETQEGGATSPDIASSLGKSKR